MNRCCGTRCCCYQWYWSMLEHKSSIDFVWRRIAEGVSMSQIIVNCVVVLGCVALETMHFGVSTILHKWLCHWDFLHQTENNRIREFMVTQRRQSNAYLRKWHRPNWFECIDALGLHHVRWIFHRTNCAQLQRWSWAWFLHRMAAYYHHSDRHILAGSGVEIDSVGVYQPSEKFKLVLIHQIEWFLRHLLWCHYEITLRRLIDFSLLHQLSQTVVNHFRTWLLHMRKPVNRTENRWFLFSNQTPSQTPDASAVDILTAMIT